MAGAESNSVINYLFSKATSLSLGYAYPVLYPDKIVIRSSREWLANKYKSANVRNQ